jgi:hypothetical protein
MTRLRHGYGGQAGRAGRIAPRARHGFNARTRS